MSERGVFAVDRGIWDHPMFQTREPLSRREAWLWLLSAATWKAKSVFVDGKRIELSRGQLAYSIRFLADQWRWPKSNVARFLDLLKTDTMIGTQSGSGITIITICKYDEYQRVSLPDRTQAGTPSGTLAGHERDKEEDREYKEEDAAPPPSLEKQLFDRGRQVLGEKAGGMIKNLLKAKNGDFALARAALEVAATKAAPREYIGAIIRGPVPREGEFTWKSGIPGVL